MDGQPVWLCSVSFAPKGRIKATGEWSADELALASRLAQSALSGVGDPARQRAFRMNVTYCVHRAVAGEEKSRLPAEWACAPGGLAGGPVEVLWSRGIEHRPAAMPCREPGRLVLDRSRPDLWVPEDCGRCPPCLARARIASNIRGVAADETPRDEMRRELLAEVNLALSQRGPCDEHH